VRGTAAGSSFESVAIRGWKISEIVGAVSAVSFVLTLVYLVGFALCFPINILHSISLSDYFRLGVLWLPPALLIWGG
jgi:hypothetical protein